MTPETSFTLIGMSGVGKTHLAALLERQGWTHYSCDLVIAEQCLAPHLARPATRDDLRPVSDFIGKIGAPEAGGLPLDEFQRRQQLYNHAECASLTAALALPSEQLVIDTTGSFCEITDGALIDAVGRLAPVVYLQTAPDDVEEIIVRQRAYPKPLYYPPAQLDAWLAEYQARHPGDIMPDEFARWVFPRLIHARLPKYQALADRYGVALPAARLRGIETAADFLSLVDEALAA